MATEDLLGMEMMAIIVNNLQTIISKYGHQEEQYRNMAMNTTSVTVRNMYITEANRYKSYIGEIRSNIIIILRHRISVSLPTRALQQPAPSLISRIGAILSSSVVQPAQAVATSTPLKIPAHLPADVPNQFICPITMDIMTDPVMLSDGHTYERKAIEKWLETKSKSPLTNNIINKDIIVPCFALRSIMQEYFDKLATSAKQGTQSRTTEKKKREPTKYNLFVKERMPVLRAQHPGMQFKDIMRLIGAEWKASK